VDPKKAKKAAAECRKLAEALDAHVAASAGDAPAPSQGFDLQKLIALITLLMSLFGKK
jgi:hypothetical protein